MKPLIAATVSLAAVLYGLAAIAGADDNPSPCAEIKANPAISRFSRSIIFYLSFDGHANAEISPGSPVPQGNAKWTENLKNPASIYAPGIYGTGLKTADYGLAYAYSEPVLGSTGAIAIWMKSEVLNHAGTYYWPINLHAPGNYDLFFGRMGDPRNKERLYAHMAGTSAIWYSGMNTWKPGEWHLFVVNWDSAGLEISIDGNTPVRASLKTALQSNVIGGFTLRLPGASDDTFIMDELFILDVPMKEQEIRQLYEEGMKEVENKNMAPPGKTSKKTSE